MEHNSDKEFIRENDSVFSTVYSGKCILVVRRKVVKTFENLCDAMLYVDKTIQSDNYVLVDYTDPEPKMLFR